MCVFFAFLQIINRIVNIAFIDFSLIYKNYGITSEMICVLAINRRFQTICHINTNAWMEHCLFQSSYNSNIAMIYFIFISLYSAST